MEGYSAEAVDSVSDKLSPQPVSGSGRDSLEASAFACSFLVGRRRTYARASREKKAMPAKDAFRAVIWASEYAIVIAATCSGGSPAASAEELTCSTVTKLAFASATAARSWAMGARAGSIRIVVVKLVTREASRIEPINAVPSEAP